MNKIILALAFLALFCAFADQVSGKDCRGIVSDLNKREIAGISTCTKAMRSQFKNVRDKIAKSTCIMKCVLKNEKILTPAGEFSQENIDAFFTREFPVELHAKIKTLVQPCIDQYSDKLDDSEEFCKSYDPAIKCFSQKLPLFCKK
jgi:hypothetical protein